MSRIVNELCCFVIAVWPVGISSVLSAILRDGRLYPRPSWASVTGLVEASLLFVLCIEMYCYVMSVLNLETFVIELFVDAFVSVYV